MLRRSSYRLASLFAVLAMAIVAVPLAHADEVVSHVRIVRLSFVEGDVAFQSVGSTWQRAMMNLPIRQGFSLRTDAGYAEVEFETGLIVHLAGNTQMEFTELTLNDGLRVTSLKLDHGTMIATANLQKGDQVRIASGDAEVIVPRNGRLRIDSVDSQNWVTAFKGKVEVRTGDNTTLVENGKALHFAGSFQSAAATQSGEPNQLSLDRSPRTDAFDKWAAQREEAQQEAQVGAGDFVRQRDYAFSTADLYNYGLWSNISGYGMAWQPYGLGAGWMPFANGLWTFDDIGADWMWTSFEPWGWMPYHFGGWVDIPGEGWFWIPQSPRTFRAATASFVTVGNQVGWTPTLATPTNPTKVKAGVAGGATQIVFAGGAQNGVIIAGPRGQLAPSANVKTVSGAASTPASTFVQHGQPTMSALAASGVVATGRAPVMPTGTSLTYTPHSMATGTANGAPIRTANGNGGAFNGPRANLGAPSASGRPVAMAPHTAPVQVQRPPSTFANVNPSGRNSGVTPVNGGFAGGVHSTAGVTAGSGAPGGSSNGSGGGRQTGAGSSGGTAPAGGAAGGGVAPGGASGKH